MEKRSIGSLQVSAVGLGCNNFGWRVDANATLEVVNAALDSGINFFDTADMYGSGQSEEYLGRALGNRRKNIILATKFGKPMGEGKSGGSPAYIRQAVEDSLKRLGTDWIDLYQIHEPDLKTPVEDTLEALDGLVKAGKVREIGCSNFSLAQLREAAAAVKPGAARYVSVQNHYSLIHREPEADVLPECVRTKTAFLPYFPLGNGLLTGKYGPGKPMPEGSRGKDGSGPKMFTEENLALAASLEKFAAARQHSMLELAFGWLLACPAVASVIAGAKSAAQVKANAAAGGWKLTTVELAQVDGIVSTPV